MHTPIDSVPDYESFLTVLRKVLNDGTTPDSLRALALLDGEAAGQLRELVPISVRRSIGAFFTPERLGNWLTEPLADAPRSGLVVLDPSCGAGDLLLSTARHLAPGAKETSRLLGVDVVSEFAEAADLRLSLLASITGGRGVPHAVRVGDGTVAPELVEATHIVLNPPFAPVQATKDCTWASGSVNGAATFLLACLTRARPGTVVRAVLPDVLRSGTNYRKWRAVVDQLAEVRSIEAAGQFDQWTDIDVFVFDGVVAGPRPKATVSPHTWFPGPPDHSVGDKFIVRVGPVVHNRDPHRGPWRPYLTSKDFPSWQTVNHVGQNRRFLGRVTHGPFVAVPRTSRPNEAHRARAALIADEREIAVDNHLITLQPRDGSREVCEELLETLRSESTSRWLDERIRCRHLTVTAVGTIPWLQP